MDSPPPPRVWSLRKDPVLRTILLAHGILVVMYLAPWDIVWDLTWWYDYYCLMPMAVLAMVAPWLWLPPPKNNRERAFWLGWSLAMGIFLATRLLYLIFPDVEEHTTGAWVSDGLYIGYYLVVLLALQTRPDKPRTDGRFWPVHPLEVGGIVAFVGILFVYFIVIPQAFSPESYNTWVPSLTNYWILDLFILSSLVYLRQITASENWRVIYSWLALAALCWVLTDFSEILYYADVWVLETYGFADILWYSPWLFVGIAGRVRVDPAPRFFAFGGSRGVEGWRDQRSRAGWLLVAAVALPVVHFGVDLVGVLDPITEPIREAVVLASLLLMLTLAYLHQRSIERSTAALRREKQRAEESQKLLAAAIERLQEGIVVADAQGVVQYANEASLGQVARGETGVGAPLLDLLPKEVLEDQRLQAALEEGHAWDGRLGVDNPDGPHREEIISLSPVPGEDGKGFLWVLVRNDVTYLAKLERQLGQAQKMEALGTLAGGIAHDFNNILGAIYGYAEILGMDMDSDSSSQEDLRGLLTAAKRAAELVSQILTFSRQGEAEKKVLGLESVVKEAVSLLRATLPSTIEIREEVRGGQATVRGVKHQIHQMVLNLGTNASHAMEDGGGVLEIGLERLPLTEAEAKGRGLEGMKEVGRLWVRDSGVGMDQNTVSRIFDPFFTTKEVGKGTGLGLSVVHGSVQDHGGSIRVQSDPGEGTLFEIFLPCCLGGEEISEEALLPPPSGKGETLLVVDDEPMLTNLAQQILKGLGYEVIQFNSSQEALRHFLDDPTRYDALLTDQTMPALTGVDLARNAREVRPDLPVLLSTGYSEVLSPEGLEEAGIARVLSKPFSRRDLGWAVAGILNPPESPPE